MKTYMIGYDLNKSGKNYEGLIAQIKSIANGYWHHLDSTWLINSNLSASEITSSLINSVGSDDEILVIAVADDWATYGISDRGNEWLQQSLKPACNVTY